MGSPRASGDRNGKQFVRSRNVGLDAVIHVGPDDTAGSVNRALDGVAIRRSVGFQNVAVESEERSTAVTFGIDPLLERVERAFGQAMRRSRAPDSPAALRFNMPEKNFTSDSQLLSMMLPTKPSQTTTSTCSANTWKPSIGPGVIDQVPDPAKQLVRLRDERVPFSFLRADRHQADAGLVAMPSITRQ